MRARTGREAAPGRLSEATSSARPGTDARARWRRECGGAVPSGTSCQMPRTARRAPRKPCVGSVLIRAKAQPLHARSIKTADVRGPSSCKQTQIKLAAFGGRRALQLSGDRTASCSRSASPRRAAAGSPPRAASRARPSAPRVSVRGPSTSSRRASSRSPRSAPRGSELLLSLRGPSSLLCTEALQTEPSPFEVRALSRVKICGDRRRRALAVGRPRDRARRASCSICS